MQARIDSEENITREQFWHQHVSSWKNSGLSKSHYCQQHDLVYHQMIYWCAKSSQTNTAGSPPAGGFAQLAVSNTPVNPVASLSLELPNGLTINHLTPQTIPFLPALLRSI